MQNSKQLLWKLKIFCRRSASKQLIYIAYVMKHQEKTAQHSQRTSFWSQKGRWKTMGMKRVMDYSLLSQAVPPPSPLKPLFALPVKGHTRNGTNPEVCRFPKSTPLLAQTADRLVSSHSSCKIMEKKVQNTLLGGGLK